VEDLDTVACDGVVTASASARVAWRWVEESERRHKEEAVLDAQ
jgi:hypothetical protein